MITVRAGPNSSMMAGPICHTKYMLNAMCSSPACNHPALRTVHQRPMANTGAAPLAPNTINTAEFGDSADSKLPPPPTEPPDINSVITQSVTQTPTTNCENGKSEPRARSIGPKPHSPGFDRPHV